MALYESDHTKFMRETLAKNPEWVEDQKVGRAIWWESRKLDLDERSCYANASEPQKPYPYDNNFAQR